MGVYTQRVRNSILPLSMMETLPATFAEWSVTDNTVDHEQSIEIIHRRRRRDVGLERRNGGCVCYLVVMRPSAVIGGNIAL